MNYLIHIPKTAGTSVVEGLEAALPRGAVLRLYGKQRTSTQVVDRVESLPPQRRERLEWLVGHQVWYGLHRELNDSQPRYFTFLRSPISRVVSDYYKILRDEEHELHRAVNEQRVSLNEFIQDAWSTDSVNHQTVFIGRDEVDGNHNARQCVVHDPSLLAKAMQRLAGFEFVGFKQTLAQDLSRLSRRLGIEIPLRHAHRPNLADDQMLAQLTPEVLWEIQQRNQMDSVLYDFAHMLCERHTKPFR